MFAQIDPAHIGVVDDLGRRAFGQHPAIIDDVGVVTNAQGFAHIVVGDQHANAPVFQEADDPLDLDHGDRVNASKGLVEQNKTRLGRQRPRNLHPPPLAARQGQRRALA